MCKKKTIISLILLALVGSLFAAQAVNMLASDIANISADGRFNTFFASLTVTFFAAAIEAGCFYLVRMQLRPQYAKRMTKLYSIIFAALGLLGLVMVVLNAVVNYHSFVTPYPFPGFSIIFLILHVVLLGVGLFGFFYCGKKMEDDQEKMKIKFLYVLKTLGYFLFVGLAFNRFGMLLGAPLYIYWRNFYMTFPFYLFLLVPMFIVVTKALIYLGIVKARKQQLILTIAGLAAAVVLVAAYAIIGINNTAMISAISPALPLERLATMPVETIIHIVACLAMTVPALVILLRNKEEAKPEEPKAE